MTDAALVVSVDTSLTIDQRGKVSAILTGVALLDVASTEWIRTRQFLEGLASSNRLRKGDRAWLRFGAIDAVNTRILHIALVTSRTTRLTNAMSCGL
jgi:hypothetical protein